MGPGDTTSSVLAYDTDVYQVEFRAGRLAEVGISGDGDTDLDLFIYDENGNRVCQDISFDDREYCSWIPRRTGPFSIEIENLGGVVQRLQPVDQLTPSAARPSGRPAALGEAWGGIGVGAGVGTSQQP